MSRSALFASGEQGAPQAAASGYEKMQELTRHGYLPDPHRLPREEGMLLRHRSAPDLILRPDGSIDLPIGQDVKAAAPPAPPAKKKSWRRAILITLGVVVYTILGLMLTIAILSD